MTGIEKYNSPAKVQRTGGDSIYGNGSDGNVVIASNTALSRDMYYNNLTINNGVKLNTSGYRVFVKGTLTLNGNIGIDQGDSVSNGTVAGKASGSTTYSIGGNSANNSTTATKVADAIVAYIETAISGLYVETSGNVRVLSGGAGGSSGAAGVVTPAANGTGATSGASGTLTLRTALQPGGPGTPGTNGVAGTNVPAAAAGVGGSGGAVVIIVAKTMAGSGVIMSKGTNATAGGPAANGTGATSGTAGTSAPAAYVHHHVDNNVNYAYPLANSVPHATATNVVPGLPHGSHVPRIESYYYGYTYRHVSVSHTHYNQLVGHGNFGYTAGQAPGGHHYGDYHVPLPATSSYFAINGIPHIHEHRPFTPGVAFSQYATHTSGNYNLTHDHVHHGAHQPAGGYPHVPAQHHHYAYPRHHVDANHGQYLFRNAGTVSHSGTATLPGGAGGNAGTPGTNGSTTAGTNGFSGGGGGIIIVSNSDIGSITTDANGGTLANVAGIYGSAYYLLYQ